MFNHKLLMHNDCLETLCYDTMIEMQSKIYPENNILLAFSYIWLKLWNIQQNSAIKGPIKSKKTTKAPKKYMMNEKNYLCSKEGIVKE